MVDHWSKGWPYTPYILMRQKSGQNMHSQSLRDPVHLRPERKLALHRFLHTPLSKKSTPLSKKSNNFSERLLCSWLSKNLFCGPNFGNSSTCVLEIFRKRAGGGEFLHTNIHLDSTNIIITRHKIVASIFLRRFLLPVSILGAIFMHTSIFSAWWEGAVEYFEFGSLPKSHNTLSSIAWCHNDVKYASSSSKMLAVGGLIYQHFWTWKKQSNFSNF